MTRMHQELPPVAGVPEDATHDTRSRRTRQPRTPATAWTLRRKLRVGYTILGLVVLVLVAGFVVLSAVGGNHRLRSVTYAQTPPHGGDHAPVWQRCGFYREPVRDEHAVHSLEHGIIWITYRPDLPEPQVEVLRALAHAQPDLIVSPYPDLPAPLVVSAWGQQTPLDTAGDPRLEAVIAAFRNDPLAPEPGAGCSGPNLWFTGSTGDPE